MSESPDEQSSSETWVPWGPPGLKVPGTAADWELVEVSAGRRDQGLVILGYGDARLILDLFGCDCLRVARVDGLRHAASHGAPSPGSGIAAWAVVGSPLGRWVADSSGHRAEETSELAIATRGWLVSLVVDSDCPPRARLSGWDGLPRPTASLAGAPLPPSGAPRGPMGWWEYLDRYGWGEWSPLEAGGRALRSEECYYMEGWRVDARGLELRLVFEDRSTRMTLRFPAEALRALRVSGAGWGKRRLFTYRAIRTLYGRVLGDPYVTRGLDLERWYREATGGEAPGDAAVCYVPTDSVVIEALASGAPDVERAGIDARGCDYGRCAIPAEEWVPRGAGLPGQAEDWGLVDVTHDAGLGATATFGLGDLRATFDLRGFEALRVARADGLRHAASRGAPAPGPGIATWAVARSSLSEWLVENDAHAHTQDQPDLGEVTLATPGWLVSGVCSSVPDAELLDGEGRTVGFVRGAPMPLGPPRGAMSQHDFEERYGSPERLVWQPPGVELPRHAFGCCEGWRLDEGGLSLYYRLPGGAHGAKGSRDARGPMARVRFAAGRLLALLSTYEGHRFREFSEARTPDGPPESPIGSVCVVGDAYLRRWYLEEAAPDADGAPIVTYSVYTEVECIDVLATGEPEVELGSWEPPAPGALQATPQGA